MQQTNTRWVWLSWGRQWSIDLLNGQLFPKVKKNISYWAHIWAKTTSDLVDFFVLVLDCSECAALCRQVNVIISIFNHLIWHNTHRAFNKLSFLNWKVCPLKGKTSEALIYSDTPASCDLNPVATFALKTTKWGDSRRSITNTHLLSADLLRVSGD